MKYKYKIFKLEIWNEIQNLELRITQNGNGEPSGISDIKILNSSPLHSFIIYN
jgi:hypothetical protein